MSKNERFVVLAAAVAGIVVLQKVAGKEAKALGISTAAVSGAIRLMSR